MGGASTGASSETRLAVWGEAKVQADMPRALAYFMPELSIQAGQTGKLALSGLWQRPGRAGRHLPSLCGSAGKLESQSCQKF